jgi:LytS/YehU family sensor histidine kinase
MWGYILFSIIFISLIVYIRIQRSAYLKHISALEQRLLLSQMNPHFVFNSLTAIQSYIFRNDAYTAGKYMSSFAKLVRLVLENSREEQIPISKEIETLRYYLLLQELRFEGKFDYNIDVDPDIAVDQITVPPMLAQPFIENAIEHGIIHLSRKGLITIRFILKGSALIIEIEDNGIGIEKSSQHSQHKWNEHQSLATKITKERIKNIKSSSKIEVKMEIIDLSENSDLQQKGTIIRFTLPVTLATAG